MGDKRTQSARDEGMTLIELVVAASVLFIVLTGILSLLMQTIYMSAQARELNVANNAVNSYVEWVRSLDFEEVAESTEPTGSIETTVSQNGAYTITIVPTVEPSDLDAEGNLKELHMQVTVTRADGYTRTSDIMVLIRNRNQYLVGTARSAATDPKVSFTSQTPTETAVVYGTSVPIQVTAQASDGRLLETGSFWVDNVRKLRSLTTTASAEWEIGSATWNPTIYYWNTTFVEDGLQWSPDGLRTVVVYVRDSEGIEVYSSRQLLVDNYPPATPAAPTHSGAGSIGGRLSWPGVYDGTTLAPEYQIQMRAQGSTSTSGNPFDTGSAWSAVPGYRGAQSSWVVAAQPFSRYYARVRALSPRSVIALAINPTLEPPNTSAWTNMAAPFVSRPRLTGSYQVTLKNGSLDKIKPTLAVTPPAFPLSSSTVSCEWHRVETGTNSQGAPWTNDVVMGTTTGSSAYSWTPADATKITSNATGIGFYVKVTCVPGGFMGGTTGTWPSNTATCPSVLSSGTLAEGTW